LLAHVQQHALPIIVPTLLLPEVSAAVSRGRRDEVLARDFALALTRLPHLIMIPLDETLARQAMDVAAGSRLRGSDAVYAAVALRFGTTLVTVDREQQERLSSVITACRPTQALDDLQ
jgi:predicted nucleic acid-binding protein